MPLILQPRLSAHPNRSILSHFHIFLHNSPHPNLLFVVFSSPLVGVGGFFSTCNVLSHSAHASIVVQQTTKGLIKGTHTVHDTDSTLKFPSFNRWFKTNQNAHPEINLSNLPSCIIPQRQLLPSQLLQSAPSHLIPKTLTLLKVVHGMNEQDYEQRAFT